MSSPTPSFLGIPVELRLDIFEQVLATGAHNHEDDLFYSDWLLILGTRPNDDDCVTYQGGVIVPLPAITSVCQQLRAEFLQLFFQRKTVWFYTFGELGSALHFAPSTVPYWRKVHIEWTGRRSWTTEGKLWHLEPGLEMLTKIPNLTHLSVDTDTIQCGADKSFDTNCAREITLITRQVIHALPGHPTLHTVEITGGQSGRYRGGGKIDLGKFREVWKRRGSESWVLMESVSDIVRRHLPSF